MNNFQIKYFIFSIDPKYLQHPLNIIYKFFVDKIVYVLYTYGGEFMKRIVNNNIIEFIENFHDIIHEIIELEKHTMCFGTGIELTKPEIHLVKVIKENPEIHVTGIADILDVTKGAISQMLVKLNNKGMIKKEINPANKSKIIINLTDKGKKAYEAHEKFHENFDSVFYELFDGYTETEIEFLIEFSKKSKSKLEKFNNSIIIKHN